MTQVRTIFRSFFVAMMLAVFAMPASARPANLPITATPDPAAGGTVSCNPSPVPYGTSTTCTAAFNPGYRFINFTGACNTTSNQCTLNNVTAPKSVTAHFALKTWAVTVSPTPVNGTVICSPSTVPEGSSSNCTVSPDPGYFLASITNCSLTGTNTCTVTPTADTTVTATFVSQGPIDCGDFASTNDAGSLDPRTDAAYIGSPGWGLVRGNNTDGNACALVNYACTLSTADNVVTCVYDKLGGQQKASFKNVYLWDPVAVDSSGDAPGWSEKRPLVSWGTVAPPVVGTDDYVPALLCNSDGTEPVPFEQMSPAQLAALLPTIPSAGFPARNPGTYPQYQPGQPAKVCVAQQGKTSIGIDTDPGSPTFGKVLVQYWTKVIDEADSSVKFPR